MEEWKNLGLLQEQRRLRVYNSLRRSGMRADEAVLHVEKLFADLQASPVDHDRWSRDESSARRDEDE